MIDGATGKIVFDIAETPLAPRSSLAAFLATPPGRAAKLVVRNDPWRTLHIANFAVGGVPFGAMLVFEDERLATVILGAVDPTQALGREQIDTLHRRWLAAFVSADPAWRPDENERDFAWGKIWVGFDVKSGGPEIVVSYR